MASCEHVTDIDLVAFYEDDHPELACARCVLSGQSVRLQDPRGGRRPTVKPEAKVEPKAPSITDMFSAAMKRMGGGVE